MSEHEKRQFKETTSQNFYECLVGDYPQRGPYRILGYLMNYAEGYFQDDFHNRIGKLPIMDADQYLKDYLEPEVGLTVGELDKKTQERVDAINRLVPELRTMVAEQKSPKELYQFLKRFEDEAGIPINPIEMFEE